MTSARLCALDASAAGATPPSALFAKSKIPHAPPNAAGDARSASSYRSTNVSSTVSSPPVARARERRTREGRRGRDVLDASRALVDAREDDASREDDARTGVRMPRAARSTANDARDDV
jgi:hypothetical protein